MQASDNKKKEEKFFFNMNNFDDDFVEEEIIEEPPPPVFSEAELEAAKRQAYAKGHEEGITEERNSREQTLAKIMDRISASTASLFAQETAREALYEREAVALTLCVFEKLFPVYQAAQGFEELKNQLQAVLESQSGQSSIHIKVSSGYAEGIERYMSALSQKNEALSFKITVDESLDEGDVLLAWADGGAIRRAEAMAQEIKTKLQEVLAGSGAVVHDGGVDESQLSDLPGPDSQADLVKPDADIGSDETVTQNDPMGAPAQDQNPVEDNKDE